MSSKPTVDRSAGSWRAVRPAALAVLALSGFPLATTLGSPSVGFARAARPSSAPARVRTLERPAAPRSTRGGGSVHARASGEGASIELSATPGAPKRGEVVRFTLSAHIAEATGALVRSLAYGDGSSAPPVAVPQYCLAFPGRAASETWRFSHSYAKAGTYRAIATAGSNCGGGHVTVRLTLHVR